MSELKENKNKGISDSILDLIQSLSISLILCAIIYILVAMPNQVQGSSMEPTVHQGEIILTNKITNWLGDTEIGHKLGLNYSRGDIIVFRKPGLSDFIKRIIAEPGDKIEISDGRVFINDTLLDESEYLPEGTKTEAGTFLRENKPLIVPEGSFFVMGDNRSNSQDSRFYEVGFVKKEWIRGEVIIRYWPPLTIFKHPKYNLF
ncbi:MAG: signal peptidase I [Bacteroidia bacterium]|nr:MAG: signal peptidase I [Bacteroidia bacterium]